MNAGGPLDLQGGTDSLVQAVPQKHQAGCEHAAKEDANRAVQERIGFARPQGRNGRGQGPQ